MGVGGEKELETETEESGDDSDQKTSFSSNSSRMLLELGVGSESGCLRRPMKRREEEEEEVLLVMGEGIGTVDSGSRSMVTRKYGDTHPFFLF